MELKRKHTALTEVLEQIEHQKQQIKDEVIANVDKLLIPIVDQLLLRGLEIDTKYLILIKRSLHDLTSSFGQKITHKSLKLTPKEIQISNMIKRGLFSKEIADLSNISYHAVVRQRQGIRKKANIINKNENLRTFLPDI